MLLFLAGAAFAYFVMLPVTIPFLADFGGIPTTPRPKDYIGFITRVVFWMGVAFETPIIIAVLARIGIVTPTQLRKGWRLAVVVIAVVAALITPTIDPFTMLIVMAPLLGLYLLSIVSQNGCTESGDKAEVSEYKSVRVSRGGVSALVHLTPVRLNTRKEEFLRLDI